MEVKLSRHAQEKLEDQASKKSGVTKEIIKNVLKEPELIDNSEYPLLMAVGKLTEGLSLYIIYKYIHQGIKIITFFPAKRGRYESKILS